MSDKNIYQRIHSVMEAIKYVQKDAQINFAGESYKAVSHDHAIAMVRPHLLENGIVVKVSQRSGGFITKRDLSANPPIKMGLYEGSYRISFINIDKPEESADIDVQAHATDNGDKAPGKAISYATKTAVLKMFSLETGENDESRMVDEERKIEQKRNITQEWVDAIRAGTNQLNEIQDVNMKATVSRLLGEVM